MARSSRSFTLATKASVAEKNAEYEDIEFEFSDPDAVPEKGRKSVPPRICVAHYPGEGAMFAMASSVGMSDAELVNPAGALRHFLVSIFGREDFRFIWREVEASRLDARDDLMALVGECMETWSAVPSQQ